mmetsp:Transcript_5477/g.16181  ORF Transcript_5477/g.16181 Transcript_5477/m.16181 type:complete len:211 (+) Transcript_5477:1072-1704(+)
MPSLNSPPHSATQARVFLSSMRHIALRSPGHSSTVRQPECAHHGGSSRRATRSRTGSMSTGRSLTLPDRGYSARTKGFARSSSGLLLITLMQRRTTPRLPRPLRLWRCGAPLFYGVSSRMSCSGAALTGFTVTYRCGATGLSNVPSRPHRQLSTRRSRQRRNLVVMLMMLAHRAGNSQRTTRPWPSLTTLTSCTARSPRRSGSSAMTAER